MEEIHKQAERDYQQGLKYKDIAEKYGVSINTVKSWKTRYKWVRKGVHTNKKVCTQKKKTGAPLGNRNAAGNSGGAAPARNQNAVTHGFYSRFIPVDEIEMLESAPGAGELERDLKVARYKLARLLKHQQEKRMQGVMGSVYGIEKYELQDDFYEPLIQKQIKLIADLEVKIHKMKENKENEDKSNENWAAALEVIATRRKKQ